MEHAAHRPEEARKEAARKAARTRAQRYGEQQDLQAVSSTALHTDAAAAAMQYTSTHHKATLANPSAGTKLNISDPSRDDLMQKGIDSGETLGVHFVAPHISFAHLPMQTSQRCMVWDAGRAAGISTYAISRYVRAGPLLVRQSLAASQWAAPRHPPPAVDPVDEGDGKHCRVAA